MGTGQTKKALEPVPPTIQAVCIETGAEICQFAKILQLEDQPNLKKCCRKHFEGIFA